MAHTGVETFMVGCSPADAAAPYDHVLTAAGDLTRVGGDLLLGQVRMLLEAGSRDFLLDVAGVTSVHRSGLAAVAQCRTAIRDAGGSLHVIPSTTNLTWAITSAGLPEPSDPNSREGKART